MIYQQINLFQVQFRPVKEPLDARVILMGGLLLLLLLTGLTVALEWNLGQREQSLAARKAEVENLRRASERLRLLLPPKSESEDLKREVEELEREVDGIEEVLQVIDLSQAGNSEGFSPILEGLARGKTPGLWLDGVGIFNGGDDLVLEGITRIPDAIPFFVRNLSRQTVLTGRQFPVFSVWEEYHPIENSAADGSTDPNAVEPLFHFQAKTNADLDINRDHLLSREQERMKRLQDAMNVGSEMRQMSDNMRDNLQER